MYWPLGLGLALHLNLDQDLQVSDARDSLARRVELFNIRWEATVEVYWLPL